MRDCINSFTKDGIRKQIQHVRCKTAIDCLMMTLKEKELLCHRRSTLYAIFKEISFKYKMDDSRRLLCEKNYVVEQRINFLRKYQDNINKKNLDVVFLDETWIFSTESKCCSWQDEFQSP